MNMLTRKRVLLGIASILAIGLIVLFVLLGNAQGDRLLTEARSAVEQREFEMALNILDPLVNSNTGDTEALLLAAQTARRANAYARAAKFLRSYEQNGGAREEVRNEERRAKAQTGDKEAAEELMRDCEQEPGAPSNFLSLEAIVQGLVPFLDSIVAAGGRASEGPELQWILGALDALLMVPMGTADRAEALYCSGKIHHIASRHSRGVGELRQALELAPHHFEARRALALAIAQASPAEARIHLEILAQQRPGDGPTLYSLALVHRALGDTADAGKIMDELLLARPEDVQYLVERALIELDAGRPIESEALLRRAANHAPNNREVLLALSKALRIQNRPAEADQFLKRCVELDAQSKRKMESIKPKSK